ncbi:hypothetical protein CDAR_190411 [Caerostris darwini]|uniref:Uncharacterized protein n=1 Tax=Caerostris darwini TaxID=1538125 RepID=A0AAV4MNF3_9ARAC|nr:hypothetical protein CDAR_190411 [Caerostris darwini]
MVVLRSNIDPSNSLKPFRPNILSKVKQTTATIPSPAVHPVNLCQSLAKEPFPPGHHVPKGQELFMQHLTLLDAPLDGCQDRKKTIALINHSVGVVLLRLKLAERVILELRSMSPEANAGIKIQPCTYSLSLCKFKYFPDYKFSV